MPLKSRKRAHKLDRLLRTLSAQDQAEFHALCQFNPSYRCIQLWLEERGCEISINGIFCWWRSNFPTADENRILRGIAALLEQDFDLPPHSGVIRLVSTAAQILCDCSTGKLSHGADVQQLMEKEIELLYGLRSLQSMPDLPTQK